MNHLPLVSDIQTLHGKKVLVRFDWNVPVEGGVVVDDFRIKSSLPTLNFLHKAGAIVVAISHIESGEKTLRPVVEYLQKTLKVEFIESFSEDALLRVKEAPSGSIFVFENIRREKGEEDNTLAFSKVIAKYGDVYVNEAFSVSHRPHASIVGVPRILPPYAGFLFDEEVQKLSRIFSPPHPFLFCIGGAKFETKLPLIKRFLDEADYVFVGGALANDLFLARGISVGMSKISKKTSLLTDIARHPKIILPTKVIVNGNAGKRAVLPTEVASDEAIMDASPEGLAVLGPLIASAHLIVWNGPLGQYEGGFTEGTRTLARMMSVSKAEKIVGGGDTVAVLEKEGLTKSFSFVSTGGGAMLDFLTAETLPGIEALLK